MLKRDIRARNTYANKYGWEFFVTNVTEHAIDYLVVSGPKAGVEGTADAHAFAARCVRRVKTAKPILAE